MRSFAPLPFLTCIDILAKFTSLTSKPESSETLTPAERSNSTMARSFDVLQANRSASISTVENGSRTLSVYFIGSTFMQGFFVMCSSLCNHWKNADKFALVFSSVRFETPRCFSFARNRRISYTPTFKNVLLINSENFSTVLRYCAIVFSDLPLTKRHPLYTFKSDSLMEIYGTISVFDFVTS